MSRTVLIIDDSETIRSEIRQILTDRAGLDVQVLEAVDVITGIKAALGNPVDLILCDLEMPGMDGFKFLAMVRARAELMDVPVIMLTGNNLRANMLRGLEQGASDYVTKPFDREELVARVRIQLKIKQLQDELKHSNAQLEALSRTDPLTQLPNRRHLEELLTKELERARRSGQTLALAVLDIDHFKRVNDNYGHLQGDEVLKVVAEVIRSQIRPYDIGARFGGEEFVLVWPQISMVEAARAADRLREVIKHHVFTGPLTSLELTVSLGLAFYPSGNNSSVDDLFARADAALYRAKREGRNRVRIAD